jgi:hypothetical protein
LAGIDRQLALKKLRHLSLKITCQGCQGAFPATIKRMSPTIFREAGFRFYFFSREEPRMHVHVQCADGEAKFWLEPADEFRSAWNKHFGG